MFSSVLSVASVAEFVFLFPHHSLLLLARKGAFADGRQADFAFHGLAIGGARINDGAFDLTALDFAGLYGAFVRSALFAYFGTANPLDSDRITEAAVPRYVTEAFPPSFTSAGNCHALAPQSVMMAQALRDRGVKVDTLFFAPDTEPKLPHEYQFDLGRPEGRQALDRLTAFLQGLQP